MLHLLCITPLGRAGFIKSHYRHLVANTYHIAVTKTSTSAFVPTLYSRSNILLDNNIRTDFIGRSKLTTLKMTTRRTSSRLKKTVVKENEKEEENNNIETKIEDKKEKPARKTKRKSKESVTNSEDEGHDKSKKKKTTTAKKKSATTKKTKERKETDQKPTTSDKKTIKKKASDHQRITDRDTIPKLWDDKKAKEEFGSYTFKICSWNVAGLRALMRNHPNALGDLAKKYDLDVICLQETKLQEIHVDDPKLKIKGHLLHDEGYDSYYSCATAKKGYSGTAVFIRKRDCDEPNVNTVKKKKQASIGSFFSSSKDDKKELKSESTGSSESKDDSDIPIDVKNLIPSNVSFKLGMEKHDSEGRIINVDFPLFSMANLYVPNSGQKLDRLSYRTDEWDKDLLQYMKDTMENRKVPVIWLGDLNVAHTHRDVWNDGAKHLAKSAGTTAEERASFQEQLEHGFVDAFRHLHPEAMGQYTYWSQRAGNREPNKGLRLDYFICSKDMVFDETKKDSSESRVFIRDSYIVHEQVGSDHCPIVLELEIKN